MSEAAQAAEIARTLLRRIIQPEAQPVCLAFWRLSLPFSLPGQPSMSLVDSKMGCVPRLGILC